MRSRVEPDDLSTAVLRGAASARNMVSEMEIPLCHPCGGGEADIRVALIL